MFTKIEITKSAVMFVRIFLTHSNSGKKPLQMIIVHEAHQYGPKARYQKAARSVGLPLYHAMKYSGNPTERAAFWYRAFGPYWWASWTMIICNGFLPLLLWIKKIRTNITALFVISIFVNVGMWFERYVIIVVSLAGEPFTKWTNAVYNPTWADWGIMAGSFGWFFMWFLLFVKNFPAVSISEVKEVLPAPRRGKAKAS